MVGVVEEVGHRHGVEHPLTMTVCALDGQRLIAVRYSSEANSRSLFHSTDVRHLKQLYPDEPRISALDDDAYMLLSEQLVELPGAWEGLPEATAIPAGSANGRACRRA